MKTVDIYHENCSTPILMGVPVDLAARLLEHDESLCVYATMPQSQEVVFDRWNIETEYADILSVLSRI